MLGNGPLQSLLLGIGNGDLLQVSVWLSVIVVILLIAFPLHELAHAVVADKLGDDTPRRAGRITLNPFKHLDLWGSALFLLAGIGWATTPINPYNLRRIGGGWRNAWALVAIAGPITNLIIALIFALLFRAVYPINDADPSFALNVFLRFCAIAVSINVRLFFFNLIPVPPLDGFTVLSAFVPRQYENVIGMLQQYGMWLLLILSFTGALGRLINPPSEILMNLLLGI